MNKQINRELSDGMSYSAEKVGAEKAIQVIQEKIRLLQDEAERNMQKDAYNILDQLSLWINR